MYAPQRLPKRVTKANAISWGSDTDVCMRESTSEMLVIEKPMRKPTRRFMVKFSYKAIKGR